MRRVAEIAATNRNGYKEVTRSCRLHHTAGDQNYRALRDLRDILSLTT
jgi:hypothetical protein